MAEEKVYLRQYQSGMTTRRIESLTDGVIAIAMTLLILNLEVPEARAGSSLLIRSLIRLTPQVFDFAIAFFVLASFWMAHHRQYHLIRRVDNGLLWINMLDLMFIVMIPFTTSLFGEHRDIQAAAVLFEINIMIIGIIKFWHWRYATYEHRLVDNDLDQRVIKIGSVMNLVTPGIALICIGISFFSPSYSTVPFALIPIGIAALRRL